MSLYECLDMYKYITLELIEKIKQDEADFEELINRRSEILDGLKEVKFSSEELKKIVDDLEIFKLEDELELLIKKEKTKIRNKIDLIKRGRLAARNYNKAFEFQNFFTARSK